ncbi:exonuclease SbcC [Tepidanaerobacter syntrophicus]|uniref:Nuclease SbcCD subunit C n=1 Tax=Tepidanaerobacter syntrophicus TaxID=224999 RepID=A0A0U9HP83_9FIRM|nr:AAA family ATPase [Tepidanaerobacter syntrophicus]GAQ26195.1 AAA domain-containing protein [Tepidanaerobacter syntrophicus]GLI19183.1 exonuclease SbcC [Tepidanaerobacter syntrophicus]GLI50185.1 exonuclease SbcC [Tepidanaerobacter syntrophicus]
MGLIKSLRLINFQSHKDTKIDFDEGLTVILGQTDQGKSAIIRALKWVLYNEPRGTDFIMAGCKLCRVSLEMDDGSVIIREREGQRNRYILIQNGKEEVFEGFGNTVPLEIARAHGIPKIRIDKDAASAVNLAEQLEPPFLISESGGNRAKALGRLVGIHIIDAAQRTVLKDITNAKQNFESIQKDIESLNSQLESYKDIVELQIRISSLQDILKKLKETRAIFSILMKSRQELGELDSEIEKNTDTIKKLDFIDKVEQNITFLDALSVKCRYLKELSIKLAQNRQNEEIELHIIENMRNLPNVEEIYSYTQSLALRLSSLVKLNTSFAKITNDLNAMMRLKQRTENIFEVEEILPELEKVVESKRKLLSTLDLLKSINNQIISQKADLEKYEAAKKAGDYLETITEKSARLAALESLRASKKSVEDAIGKGYEYLKTTNEALSIMAKKYSQILQEAAICPLCLQPIDKETVKKIVSDILN